MTVFTQGPEPTWADPEFAPARNVTAGDLIYDKKDVKWYEVEHREHYANGKMALFVQGKRHEMSGSETVRYRKRTSFV